MCIKLQEEVFVYWSYER